jgi:hypothetical protein
LALGDAAVTGFSGALAPIQIAPGVDPGEQTFIDLDGPSLRVVDLHHMGGPPTAQLVGAPKPFTFTAAQIGQVFGVALDDNSPPNIYVAATSAYGLPIVAPGAARRKDCRRCLGMRNSRLTSPARASIAPILLAGTMRRPSAAFSASPFISIACITGWPMACKFGR